MAELRPARVLSTRRLLHRGMAGESRRVAAAPGSAGLAQIRERLAPRLGRIALAGRRGVALLLALFLTAAEAQVTATRMWPARDYTRLTIESKAPVKYEVLSVTNPDRVVLDLEADLTAALSELDGKVVAEDPYVKGLRVGRNRPGIVRV